MNAILMQIFLFYFCSSDNVSVASDLTRMYVSDEDERHEFRVPHYH